MFINGPRKESAYIPLLQCPIRQLRSITTPTNLISIHTKYKRNYIFKGTKLYRYNNTHYKVSVIWIMAVPGFCVMSPSIMPFHLSFFPQSGMALYWHDGVHWILHPLQVGCQEQYSSQFERALIAPCKVLFTNTNFFITLKFLLLQISPFTLLSNSAGKAKICQIDVGN